MWPEMSREEFFAQLDARRPRFDLMMREIGYLETRQYIIGSVPDALPGKRDLIEWWDQTYSQLN